MTSTSVCSENHVFRSGVEFVTFYTALSADENVHPNQSLAHREHLRNIRLMFRSAKLFHPRLSMTLLTDPQTRCPGIPFWCKRVSSELNPKQLMLERAMAQLNYIRGNEFSAPIILLDNDILINGSLGAVLEREFDVALTWRDDPEMPINGGFVILNNQRPEYTRAFCERVVSTYRERYADKAAWFGDQLAVRDCVGLRCEQMGDRELVEVDGCRVLLLPCETYNFSPKNQYQSICSPLTEKRVIHFKGERKRLMALYANAWLRPVQSRMPWAQLESWRTRRWLERESVQEQQREREQERQRDRCGTVTAEGKLS